MKVWQSVLTLMTRDCWRTSPISRILFASGHLTRRGKTSEALRNLSELKIDEPSTEVGGARLFNPQRCLKISNSFADCTDNLWEQLMTNDFLFHAILTSHEDNL